MFPFFFSIGFFQWLDDIMKKPVAPVLGVSTNQKYTSYLFNDDVYNLIKVTELQGRPIKTIAYKDNQWTIGYGTSSLFNENGSFRRMVKPTDTFAILKKEFNKVNFTDEQFGRYLVQNYCNNVNGYQKLAKVLDSSSVPFNKYLALGIYDWAYNSGSAFTAARMQKLADSIKYANGNSQSIAKTYLKFRLDYVKGAVKATDWTKYKRGWMCRYYWVAKKIADPSYSNSLQSVVSVNNPSSKMSAKILSEFGLIY